MEELNVSFRHQEVKDRNIDELIGLCRGILSDDIVCQKEAEFLKTWIESHFHHEDTSKYPINTIYDRLSSSLKDNILDEVESLELKELLQCFTGEKPITEQVGSMSSTLPLCNPLPEVDFIDKNFVMTGAFTIGTRKTVENLIKELGGSIQKSPGLKTNFLIVGILGSSDWIHSSYGRKIEKAVEIRDIRQKPLRIISEEHFIKFI